MLGGARRVLAKAAPGVVEQVGVYPFKRTFKVTAQRVQELGQFLSAPDTDQLRADGSALCQLPENQAPNKWVTHTNEIRLRASQTQLVSAIEEILQSEHTIDDERRICDFLAQSAPDLLLPVATALDARHKNLRDILLTEAVVNANGDPGVLYWMMHNKLRSEEDAVAAEKYARQAALHLRIDSPPFLYEVGNVYATLRQSDRARSYYLRACKQ